MLTYVHQTLTNASTTPAEKIYKQQAPGLEPDEIDIQVVNNMLVVRGEKRLQKEHEDGRYHVVKCAYGSFERAIPLQAEVMPKQTTSTAF